MISIALPRATVFCAHLACLILGHALLAQSAPSPELTEAEAGFQQRVEEKAEAPFLSGKQRLQEAYRASLEAAFKKSTDDGRLDESIALQEEVKRFAADATVPEQDASNVESGLARLRAAWRAENTRLSRQRTTSLRPLLQDYLGELQRLEKSLTRAVKIDEAKEVRARVEKVTAQLAEAAAAGQTPPAADPLKNAAPLPSAVPPVKAEITSIGAGKCAVHLNEREVFAKVFKDKISHATVELQEGDVIAVANRIALSETAFWLVARNTNGSFLFDTGSDWRCYVPNNPKTWWNVKDIGSVAAVKSAAGSLHAPEVKKLAASTTRYAVSEPIRSVFKEGKDDSPSFYYHIITKQDLSPKNFR